MLCRVLCSWGKLLKLLTKLAGIFLWGSSPKKKKKKLQSVSWGKITRPKKEGGLRLSEARPINLALFAELNWRMHVEKDQAWAKFLQRKYANQERKCSRTWAAMK